MALVLGAVPFAFWTFFRFIPDALSWAPVASLALLFVFSIELLARVTMFRFIEGIGRSTFWTGLRLMQFMALVICAISAGLQLYALVAGLDRWLPYLLGGTSLLIVSLPWCDGAIAVLVLSSSRASPGADRARRRAVWAILLLIEKVVSTILYAVMLTFDHGQGGLELAALIFTAALAGQVCLWGLFASVHRDIVEASMADTFSYDPETPEPRRV